MYNGFQRMLEFSDQIASPSGLPLLFYTKRRGV
jgi:hypothetical protein